MAVAANALLSGRGVTSKLLQADVVQAAVVVESHFPHVIIWTKQNIFAGDSWTPFCYAFVVQRFSEFLGFLWSSSVLTQIRVSLIRWQIVS